MSGSSILRRLLRFAAQLYPRSWKRRYGPEFDALLDDTAGRWRDLIDILVGAIKMQLSTWSLRNLALAGGLAGLTLAVAIAFALPNRYVSRACLRLTSSGGESNDQLHRILQEAFSRQSLAEIIQRPDLDLYRAERAREPLEDVVERMKNKDIGIELVRPPVSARFTGGVFVSFDYPDPVVAQKTTAALISRLVEVNQQRASNQRLVPARLDVLDPASTPRSPTAPNRPQIAVLGLVAGLMLGIGAGLVHRKRKPLA